MNPQEIDAICALMEHLAKSFYELGVEYGAGKEPPDFKLSPANKMALKTSLEKALRGGKN